MPAAAALYPFVRGFILLAILLLIGTVVATRLASRHLQAVHRSHVDAWHSRLPGLVAWFLLTLSLARGALQLLSFTDPGEPLEGELVKAVLLEGTWGVSWMLQTSAALVLLAGSWLMRARPAALRALSVACVATIVWAQSGMGHPADDLWPSVLGRAVSVLHVSGAGIWLGTLGVLTLTTFPVLRERADVPVLAAIVRDFSVWARAGVALVIISGVVATWKYVNSFAALVGSGYGRLVLAKIALVAVIAAAGWWNWRIVTPSLEGSDESAPQWLRMGVTIELVLGTVVLALTAVLVGSWLPVDGWR